MLGNKFFGFCWTFLFSKFYFFKALALLCTLYILYQEFRLFFIEKPTSTSLEKIKLSETFPKIAICPVIGLNITQFYAHGYNYEYAYFTGYFVGDYSRG